MKQHQWLSPLLSMLASTAMCALLSFNQPILTSDKKTKGLAAPSLASESIDLTSIDNSQQVLNFLNDESLISSTQNHASHQAQLANNKLQDCRTFSNQRTKVKHQLIVKLNTESI